LAIDATKVASTRTAIEAKRVIRRGFKTTSTGGEIWSVNFHATHYRSGEEIDGNRPKRMLIKVIGE
jgi:hypothetical protein